MAHRRRFIGTGASALAFAVLIALPAFSSGATVKNDLRSFQSAQTRATTATPQIEPPLHGTNPHGQGTAAVIDLTPSAERPFAVNGGGSSDDEDVVVGRARGEQRADGTYHGHITVAALFGNEVIAGADTAPGQQVDRAIGADLLASLCTATSICLDLVRVTSSTTSTSSLNRFTLASAALGGTPGVPALRIGAAESTGNITSDGTCQTSSGGSQVADVRASTAVANVARSTSTSTACRGAAPTQANTSSVIELGGTGLPVPAAGCANGTPDTATGLPPLLPIICNADDSSATGGTQAAAPYGVRNALDVYVLAVAGGAAAQVSTAQSESLAVAPAAVTPPPPPTVTPPPPPTVTPPAPPPPAAPVDGGGPGGPGDDGDDDDGGDDGAGDDGGAAPVKRPVAAGDQARLDDRKLPFTGTDAVVLGLAGAILLAAGLTLRGPARRREDGF